jgi:hypothetical protein
MYYAHKDPFAGTASAPRRHTQKILVSQTTHWADTHTHTHTQDGPRLLPTRRLETILLLLLNNISLDSFRPKWDKSNKTVLPVVKNVLP